MTNTATSRANTTQLCAGFTTPGHASRAVAIRSREFIERIRDAFAQQHGEIPSVSPPAPSPTKSPPP